VNIDFECDVSQGKFPAPIKLLEVPFSYLRARGHGNSAYIDDSCLISMSFLECQHNVFDTVKLLDQLGFTIHPDKSVLTPGHVLVYLGFVLDSLHMTVTLTHDKGMKIQGMCNKLRARDFCTIRELAEIIGTLVASEPAVDFAPLYYKGMEHYKNTMLQCNKGDYEATVSLPGKVKEDLAWWENNILKVKRNICRDKVTIVIASDSSDFARGGVREGKSAGVRGVNMKDFGILMLRNY